MKRLTTAATMTLAALAAAGFTVFVSDVRIETRVDASIRKSVAAIVDSLQREGVSAEPLIDYALEGTGKLGSAGSQAILTGVRKWARDLRRSRQLLGPNATPDEVSAGAKALRAGAPERELERFKEGKKEQRFASALNTMAYLITSGVPADTASRVLVNVALASASDDQIRTLQDEIERDINRGTPPGVATIGRAVGLLEAINAGRDSTDSVAPGAALPSTRGTARPADPMANGNLGRSAVGNQGDAARPPAPRGKDIKRP
jgi:hypothetical protein